MKKSISFGVLALCMLAACGRGASGSYFSPAAAVVNGEKISEERLSIQLRKLASDPQTRSQFIGPSASANRVDAKREVLNQMIEVTLVSQAAGRLGLKVSDSEVIGRIESLESNYGGKKKFAELLRREGLFEDELKELLHEQLLYQKVAQAVTSDAAPSEKELLDYYEQNKSTFTDQVRAAHILVCANSSQESRQCTHSDQDLKLAQDITKRARSGEDFAALAKEYSRDETNKNTGGDLGYFGRGRMTPDFESAAFALAAPGDISDPIKTDFGYHVIKLLNKGKTFEESKEDIKGALGEERQQQVYRKWLQERYTAAKIRVNPKFGRFDRSTNQVVPTVQRRQITEGFPGGQRSP